MRTLLLAEKGSAILVSALVLAGATSSVSAQSVSLRFVSSWGDTGDENGLLDDPREIAVDEGSVYVWDQTRGVVRFTKEGDFVESWGNSGMGLWRLGWVQGLEVNSAGEVVAVDGYLKIFDLSLPKPLRYLPARYNKFGGYYGLAIAPGDTLYMCNPSRIDVRLEDGALIRSWGSPDPGDDSIQGATGIEIDGMGHVYVVDFTADRILKFDTGGHFVLGWGGHGNQPGQFDRPQDIAIGPDQNLYIVDSGNHRIQVFDPGGRQLLSFGRMGSGPGEFFWPNGIAIDTDGFVYVTDNHNNRVQKLESSITSVEGSTWTSMKSRFR